MFITYHEAKRFWTLRERGLDFEDATSILTGPRFTRLDGRRDYGETRFQTVGWLDGVLVMLVWTRRGDAVHVISLRRCNERERAVYGDRLL